VYLNGSIELEFKNLEIEPPFNGVSALSCWQCVRAKFAGWACATCLIGWFASGWSAGKSEAGAKRQGEFWPRMACRESWHLQQEKLLVTFGYKSYGRKKL